MKRFLLPLSLAALASLGAVACASETDDEESFEADRCDEEGVTCQAYGRKNTANRPPAYELGDGVRAPKLSVVYQGQKGTQPVDLEFNPRSPRELWVVHYATSHTSIVTNPGRSTAKVIERRDPAYSHFMNAPPSIAMGSPSAEWGQTWGTCGDGDNGGNNFMGPTLYSARLDVYGGENQQTGLGSHLDMLHSTSYCRGMAWAGTGNQYWAFNAQSGSIDFYDFRADHGPGWDDHSDGVIRRFANKKLRGVRGVVSHLSWDAETKRVYVADTGNRRIVALDPSQARAVAPLPGNEPIVERKYYEAPLTVLTDDGLVAPSGIEATGGLAFVTDAATSKIHAFSLEDGALVKTLDTGLPQGSLAGLNFGPEGKIYFVDRLESRVYRIDP